MAHEQEVQWQSYVGVTYELQSTLDLISWQVVQTYQGTGEKISYVTQTIGPKKFFRLKQTFKDGYQGSEVLDLRAIVAWDGTYVILEWNLYLSPPSGSFKVLKDNQQIAEVPFTSYQNSYIHSQPGPGSHIYAVRYWS